MLRQLLEGLSDRERRRWLGRIEPWAGTNLRLPLQENGAYPLSVSYGGFWLDQAVSSNRYAREEEFLPTTAWEANEATLARHLSDEEWDELPILTHSVARLRAMYARRQHGRPLTNEEVERNAELAETASSLYTMLTGKPVDGGP